MSRLNPVTGEDDMPAHYVGDECTRLSDYHEPDNIGAEIFDMSNTDVSAWTLFLNIKSGLPLKKDALSVGELHVIKLSLFEKMAEFGVSKWKVMAILSGFRLIDEAIAEKKLN